MPGAYPRDAKLDLMPGARRELVRRSRYLHKNSGFVRELVGNMAIYATGDGIKPQALSGNTDWNKAAEEYFARWAARCEITQRFCFAECQALVCRGMDVDGEYFVHKTRNADGVPRLQLIESHRIGDADRNDTEDGIGFDEYGAPAFYRVLLDDGSFRGHPGASHAPRLRAGVCERGAPGADFAAQRSITSSMRWSCWRWRNTRSKTTRTCRACSRPSAANSMRTAISPSGTRMPAQAEASDPGALQKIVGGKLVSLKPGESLDSFQPNRPSPTFTGFLEHLRRDSALGHIPYEFAADSSKVGGAGVRLVVAKADRRFSYRQLILIERFLKPVWLFVIGDAIATEQLAAVENWTKVAFTTPRRITVDAGREAQQNRADVEMGLKTLDRAFRRAGHGLRRGDGNSRAERARVARSRGEIQRADGNAVEAKRRHRGDAGRRRSRRSAGDDRRATARITCRHDSCAMTAF